MLPSHVMLGEIDRCIAIFLAINLDSFRIDFTEERYLYVEGQS